ncbi:MAG: ATP-binding protein [Clostridia bacterium]|nr:ATP-binding protein [Clostridia bacterium]
MIIAVASGKGGTGKTTLSVALALSADEKVNLLDCDVEEPNTDIFLNLKNKNEETVNIAIPYVTLDKCNFCGKCREVCQFNAISVLKNKVLIFDELCHSCGGCMLACPQNAISEKNSPIGTISSSESSNISFFQGRLDIGQAMSPPLIRAVKAKEKDDMLNIIDCPPGSSCPVITAVNGADYIVLVTEASPFGLNDLKITINAIREINIPFGVIINRASDSYKNVQQYCENENIDILLEIPESVAVAKSYSEGGSLLDAMPQLKPELRKILDSIMEKSL